MYSNIFEILLYLQGLGLWCLMPFSTIFQLYRSLFAIFNDFYVVLYYILYNETCLNHTVNKPESCISRTLNIVPM